MEMKEGWILERNESEKKNLVNLVSFGGGKGRGLVACCNLEVNSVVLVEECVFLRLSEKMCVKCRSPNHVLSTCPEEGHIVKPLLASFPGCEGLLSQFFLAPHLVETLLSTLSSEGEQTQLNKKSTDDHLLRVYHAAPVSYRARLSEEQFLKLYRMSERNAHTIQNGQGVFPLLSMMNHSCAPNCVYIPLSGTTKMAIKTVKPVLAGDELFISYVSSFFPVGVRQKILFDRYGFECSCPLCAPNVPDRTRCFVCSLNCPGPVMPEGRGDGKWQCNVCGR